MLQVPVIGLLLSGLLILTSCGDPSYHVRQPLGYGEMPPGETWVAVDSAYQFPSRNTVYFDPKTIHRDRDLVTLWQLTDYRWKQGGIVGRRFLSSTTQTQFDCSGKRYRHLGFRNFSCRMATGDPRGGYVDQDSWFSVELESINHSLWEAACTKQ